MLERNESRVDRLIRATLGAGLLWSGLAPFYAGGARRRRIALALAGGVLLFTAITGHCMIYSLTGISTYKR